MYFRNIISGRRLVGALRAWAGEWLSGLWESVRLFYFDPKFVRANAARTKPFMTKWPIRKPLDFPPMLQTCSREEENLGGRFKQSKVACSAHKCGGQLVGRLSGGLAGGKRWRMRAWRPPGEAGLQVLTLRQGAWLDTL